MVLIALEYSYYNANQRFYDQDSNYVNTLQAWHTDNLVDVTK